MFGHILKFLGLLFLLSIVVKFAALGLLIGSAVVFYGLWKITE